MTVGIRTELTRKRAPMLRALATVMVLCGLPAMPVPAADAGAQPSPNIYAETIAKTAARTGYSVEEIVRYFPPIQTWGKYGIDVHTPAATYDRTWVKPAPPPYTHPRVLLNPEDVPLLRKRMRETHLGVVYMRHLRAQCYRIHPDRRHWEKEFAYGNVTDALRRKWLARGVDIGTGVYGYNGQWCGDLWAEPESEFVGYVAPMIPLEAFRCLIDEDEAGMKQCARVLTAYAKHLLEHPELYNTSGDWQDVALMGIHPFGPLMAYDIVYGHMTEPQRGTVRKAIADVTRGKTYIGVGHVPAWPGTTSNWCPMMAKLGELVLCIEGEEGYDPVVFGRVAEQMRKWVFVCAGPEGGLFEGLNKITYDVQRLPALAKRGYGFIGTKYAKGHPRKFMLHTMLPWGGINVLETTIGTPRDIDWWKYTHPSDPVIDLFYGYRTRLHFKPLFKGYYSQRFGRMPRFLCDPTGAEGDMYDWGKAFDRVMRHLREDGEPLVHYDDYRGIFTARAGWNRNAAFLFFEPRNVPGGHPRRSRNEFVFASHGRLWSWRTTAVEDGPERHSVVLIDGRGARQLGRTCAVASGPLAAFATGDATLAYRHRPGGDTFNPYTPNDLRLRPSKLPWMNMPLAFLPQWGTGKKGGERFGCVSPNVPTRSAFRTCGLVRGKYPYALILDQVEHAPDGKPHLYEWQMMLPPGMEESVWLGEKRLSVSGRPERTAPRLKGDALDTLLPGGDGDDALTEPADRPKAPPAGRVPHAFDMLLKDPAAGRDRRLLVRVLQVGAAGDQVLPPRVQWQHIEGVSDESEYKLVLSVKGGAGLFRVLLFPHREGEGLPETSWTDERTLAVAWPDQRDAIQFSPTGYGPDDLRLSREGTEDTLVLTHPEGPLPTLQARTAEMNRLHGDRWHALPSALARKYPIVEQLGQPQLDPEDPTDPRIVKRYGDGFIWPTHPDWYRLACYGLSDDATFKRWLRGELGGAWHSANPAINLSHKSGSYDRLRFVPVGKLIEKARGTDWGRGRSEQEIGKQLAAQLNHYTAAVFATDLGGPALYGDFGKLWRGRQVSYNDGHLRVILSDVYWQRVRPVLGALSGGPTQPPDYTPRLVQLAADVPKGWPGPGECLKTWRGKWVVWLDAKGLTLLALQDRLSKGIKLGVRLHGVKAPAAADAGPALEGDGGLGGDDPILGPKRYSLHLDNVPLAAAYLKIGRMLNQEPLYVHPRLIFAPIKRDRWIDCSAMPAKAFDALPENVMRRVTPGKWEAGKGDVGLTRQVAVGLRFGARQWLVVHADRQTAKAVAAALAKDVEGREP